MILHFCVCVAFLFFFFIIFRALLNLEFWVSLLIFSCNDRYREVYKLQSVQSVSQSDAVISQIPMNHMISLIGIWEKQQWQLCITAIYCGMMNRYFQGSQLIPGTLHTRFKVSVLWLDVVLCFLLHRGGRQRSDMSNSHLGFLSFRFSLYVISFWWQVFKCMFWDRRGNLEHL